MKMLLVLVVSLVTAQIALADSDWGDIDIISASRTFSDSGVKLSVKYKVDGDKPVRVYWRDAAQGFAFVDEQSVEGDDGVIESSIVIAPGMSYVLMSVGDNMEWITLALYSSTSGDLTQDDITFPVLEVDPDGEISFTQGEDKEITVTHSAQTSPDVDARLARYIREDDVVVYQDPRDSKLYSDLGFGTGFMKVLQEEETDDGKINIKVKIHTSNYGPNGLIMFTSELLNSDDLVGLVQIGESVALYPSTKSAAFDAGFLGIVNENKNPKTDDGAEIILCEQSAPVCMVVCRAAGTDLQKVTVSKVLDGGQTSELASENAFSGEQYIAVQNQFKPSESAPARYQCDAYNTNNAQESKVYEVQFYKGVKIDHAFYYYYQESGSVELYCYASGTPDMKISFWVASGGPFPWIQYSPDKSVANGEMVGARMTLFLSGSETSVLCVADQVVLGVAKPSASYNYFGQGSGK